MIIAASTLRQKLKRSFISWVMPTVHTNPSRKWRFSKTLFKLENFENAVWVFNRETSVLKFI